MIGDRRRRRLMVLVLAVLLLLGTAAMLTDSGTQAPAPTLPGFAEAQTSHPLLRVVQTSTMVGLAPGVSLVPIAGRVINNGDDSAFIVAVEVEIISVTAGRGIPDGVCRKDYYRLSDDTRMPVGRSLESGAAPLFTGASIGFSTAVHNQDACQGATVHLLYTTDPE